ncbi:hypothetical protein WK41_32455 [Burkholderia cepacia]|nr:hypothetical protein WK41_32455 [Burkholderia cepacia]
MFDMNKQKRLVIISRNISLVRTVSEKVMGAEYKQHIIHGGPGSAQRLTNGTFSVMLIGFEDINSAEGWALLARRKQAMIAMPIVVVTPEADDVCGAVVLEAGADAYVAETASCSLFVSYLGALVRRAEIGTRGLSTETYGRYEFDLLGRRIFLCGERVRVNISEFYLCLLFFRNVGRLLSVSQIAESIWGGAAEIAIARIRMIIVSLKRKLKLAAEFGYLITSIRGLGYRLDVV